MGGSVIHPRSSSVSSKLRAAMSLSCPVNVRQFDGQTAAAPVGIGSDQASDLFQIVVVDEAALKDDACHTPSKVAYGGVWSSAEFLCGWEEADPKT